MTTKFLVKPNFCKAHFTPSNNMMYRYGTYVEIQAQYQYDRVFVRLGEQWRIFELDDYYEMVKMLRFLYA